MSNGKVAIVAAAPDNSAELYQWTSHSEAVRDVGDCALSQLAQTAICNGASLIYGIPSGEFHDYNCAFQTAAAIPDASIIVCDSPDSFVHESLKTMIQECALAKHERIAIVSGAAGESQEKLIKRAGDLNCERVVLAAGGPNCAAAIAGVIAGNPDPAVPLAGAPIYGLDDLKCDHDNHDIDLLTRYGVTTLKTTEKSLCIAHSVTTRTTTAGAVDTTWRNLNTILIMDEVIPGLRNDLHAKFSQAESTEQTRNAIRARAIANLEQYLCREIISGYDSVIVWAPEKNTRVHRVKFSFTVADGRRQTWLTTQIQI